MTKNSKKCDGKMEIWTRIVGYFRPTISASIGKREEIKMRKMMNINEASKDQKDIQEESMQ